MVGGEVYGSGTGRSKKEAEQEAAAAAWTALRERSAASLEADAGSPGSTNGDAAG